LSSSGNPRHGSRERDRKQKLGSQGCQQRRKPEKDLTYIERRRALECATLEKHHGNSTASRRTTGTQHIGSVMLNIPSLPEGGRATSTKGNNETRCAVKTCKIGVISTPCSPKILPLGCYGDLKDSMAVNILWCPLSHLQSPAGLEPATTNSAAPALSKVT
jgi:hypothetical protein